MMIIRQEKKTDYEEVGQLLKAAFGQDAEATLVSRLRQDDAFVPELSLVAELNGRVVGHILFTKVSIVADDGARHTSLALAPMAVLPDFQKKGIGAQLVKAGLEKARNVGYTSVIVLGHPEYYPRFGFRPAAEWEIRAPFDGVPSEAFMAMELIPGSLKSIKGEVAYTAPFYQL